VRGDLLVDVGLVEVGRRRGAQVVGVALATLVELGGRGLAGRRDQR
jgi:hypothetical protein